MINNVKIALGVSLVLVPFIPEPKLICLPTIFFGMLLILWGYER